uniref:Uncharacterized protein n=1 Tax=Methylophaga nitratireducenticrescens TaxID=754476 RepID=I1XN50_METNJ
MKVPCPTSKAINCCTKYSFDHDTSFITLLVIHAMYFMLLSADAVVS